MAILYWIRRPEHTDITLQGYVGVSSRSLEERLAEHIKVSGESRGKTYAIHKAIQSTGIENLTYSVILIADEDYCYDVEYKLRPHRNIGWNISEGGNKPPSKLGFKHSEESKEKISKIWKGKNRSPESVAKSVQSRRGFKHSEESLEKMRAASTGRKYSPESIEKRVSKIRGREYSEDHRNKISESRLSKNPWDIKPAKKETWELADVYYEYWLEEKSPYKIARRLGLKHKTLAAMWKWFDRGYIPRENTVWLETFKGEYDAFSNK